MKKRLILFIAVVTLLISTFLFQFMLIQGESMEPAFSDKQLVILNKYNHNYQAGDVVAFYCEALEMNLVKRIAAVPGDEVQIVNGKLYVNDSLCTWYEWNISYAGLAADKIVLGEDEYFVLGDNVEFSKDSRYEEVGIVKHQDIIGRIIE